MRVSLQVRPSLVELVGDEALSDRVEELVRRPESLVRVVADELVRQPVAIADGGHDLHQPGVQARAIVEDRLSFLWSWKTGRNIPERYRRHEIGMATEVLQ